VGSTPARPSHMAHNRPVNKQVNLIRLFVRFHGSAQFISEMVPFGTVLFNLYTDAISLQINIAASHVTRRWFKRRHFLCQIYKIGLSSE
jgi:hypothetical protein